MIQIGNARLKREMPCKKSNHAGAQEEGEKETTTCVKREGKEERQ